MTGSYESHMKRGQLLHEQGRHAEAEEFFKQALTDDPHSPHALLMLAWCQFYQDDRDKDALATIETAIGLEPAVGDFHGLRAMILTKLKRHKEAHESADHAIALDPDDPFSYAVKAQTFAGEEKWARMEEAAREALARDGDHDFAQNMLTQALLLQGKTEENAFNVERQLARDPDDPMPHFNAGYAALRSGDHKKAEEHFRESLRLQPSFDAAREGMLEAFRARSIVYRSYLKWSFWMAQFGQKYRIAIMIGLYVVYRIVVGVLQKVSPLLALPVIAIYLLFALWTHVARGVGNLIVLTDPSGRLALRAADKWEGILVGGGIVVGFFVAIGGAFAGITPLAFAGAAMGTAAIPLSAAFNNDDKIGVKLYGTLAIAIFLMGTTCAILSITGNGTGSIFSAWMLTFVASIWISAFGVKRG